MRHTRTLCLAAAVTAATFGLAACGGATTGSSSKSAASAQSAPPMASVADAMALVTKQSSAYTSMKMTMTEVVPKMGTISSTGSLSTRPLAMDLTVSDPQFTQSLGTGSVRMLLSGDVMYMDMGAKGAQELGGKQWMKLDLSSLGASGQAMSQMMNQSSAQSPASTVQLLTSSGDIRRVGQETVDGVPTTHYTGVVDIKKLLTQETKGSSVGSTELKTLLSEQSGLGLTTENVDLWVNAQNLPVRVHETAQTSTGPLDVTVDYSDFSTAPLTPALPPASDTVDYSQLLKQEQQSQAG